MRRSRTEKAVVALAAEADKAAEFLSRVSCAMHSSDGTLKQYRAAHLRLRRVIQRWADPMEVGYWAGQNRHVREHNGVVFRCVGEALLGVCVRLASGGRKEVTHVQGMDEATEGGF